MNVSAPFIRRPIATYLLCLALVAAGLISYTALPRASLPKIDVPAVLVTADFPGANAETMASAVARPLLEEFSNLSDVDVIRAVNREGSTAITVEFYLGRDADQAVAETAAAVTRAQARLPGSMPTAPRTLKLDPTDVPVLLLVLSSASRPLPDLEDFARRIIQPMISDTPGVGAVSGEGSGKSAIRIDADPLALTARNMTISELGRYVRAAVDAGPLGSIAGADLQVVLQADTQPSNAAAFRDLVVSGTGGTPVRLSDIAKISDSVEHEQRIARYDGHDAYVLSIRAQADADIISVADGIRELLPKLRDALGSGVNIEIVNDRSTAVANAVHDVELTMIITTVFMFALMFALVGRLSSTLIPSLVVPVTLAGTFAGLHILGLSLDNITLLALTLSIGLIIDDAIVMHENVVRHLEEGVSPIKAAMRGSKEVGFTIVSMTLSLGAVFLPVLMMGGIVGRILNSFAVTVVIALAVSALVSVTLTPTLAAYWLRPSHPNLRERLSLLECGFHSLLRGYEMLLDVSLKFWRTTILIFVFSVVATGWMLKEIPKGFLPGEDTDQLVIALQAQPDTSFAAMNEMQGTAEVIVSKSPFVAHVLSEVGNERIGAVNEGHLFVELRARRGRPPISEVMASLRKELAAISGLTSTVATTQSARMAGGKARGAYQFWIQADTLVELASSSNLILEAMKADTLFRAVSGDLLRLATHTRIVVDQEKAGYLGLNAGQIRAALHASFGRRPVATIQGVAESQEVFLAMDPVGTTSDRLHAVTVRANTGSLVPLAAVAAFERTVGPAEVNQVGTRPVASISFDLSPEGSIGEAISRIEAIRAKQLKTTSVTIEFGGSARAFKESMADQGLLLVAAVLVIYIVLGMLYESLVHPLTILTGLPAAATGALGALMLFDMELSLMALIGLLVLIGIAKKNAIMMVDVALDLQRQNIPAREAIRTACLRRFRPIMMTTMAALAAALPIAIGYGASAELRQPLGVAVAGGLLVSQVLTLFITPVIFLCLNEAVQRFRSTFFAMSRGRGCSSAPN